MEVVITGASGYLGQHLTAELTGRGAGVRAIVRAQSSAADLAVLKALGATIFVGQLVPQSSSTPDPAADLTGVSSRNALEDVPSRGSKSGPKNGLEADQCSSLVAAFAGADCAVHLIGSVAPPKGGPGIDELHRSYTSYFARACVQGGIKRAVLVTALGADQKSASQYLSTKRLAEMVFIECLEAADIICTVVRPSLVVGRLVGRRDSKLVERYRTLLNTRPVVPLVGGGSNMLEPVFVGDLACAIATILEQETSQMSDKISDNSSDKTSDRTSDKTSGKTSDKISDKISSQIIEIGGPQRVSMRQFVAALAASMAVSKPMVNLPYSVAAMAAGVLGKIQDVPLLSADQVKLAGIDMVAAINSLPELLAPALPTTLSAALDSYKVKARIG